MNIYLVVEGDCTEILVYKEWITFANKSLKVVTGIPDVSSNSVYLVSGSGWPNYLNRIKSAIEDINSIFDDDGMQIFSRLVIAIDTEDFTLEDKKLEIEECIKESLGDGQRNFELEIVIHNFCIETWFLGRCNLFRRDPSEAVKEHRRNFDVSIDDPELLIIPDKYSHLTRAKYAKKYLKTAINDKFHHQTYESSNPGPVTNKKYYDNVVARYKSTNDIRSFGAFMKAFC
ncbi:hypothetical protein [Acidithiobacillus ferrooxidans]|uniref:hypothetical protein n=1 Tax=Acidithiobacillus ferrooxidans TaxID=920 RepID=UPI0015DBFC91|nr:hypothetical protein [Acidithiobacillus ferrooxidans]MCR1341868.1 RloB family protein [Acidithiobacillus ferrooxidans]QLK42576.1 RloB domain-containing protein [Acidithiobacillus ferrooxidans]QZT51659.1 RloB family protein [Acidithiobacillus ferrooxidans]BDB15022.1 hypothetical protein ANFP_23420 [Acidithiobacillus ferrooxidans]